MIFNKTSLKFILGFITIVALALFSLAISGYIGFGDTTDISATGVNISAEE